MKRKAKAYNELQRSASIRDERTTPSAEKMRRLPPSLNQIDKNETD
jgi:hypothetical protein